MPEVHAAHPASPAGVVFDCDGTLADTETLSFQAWSATLADRGYRMTEDDLTAVIGRPFADIRAHFEPRVDLGDIDELRTQVRTRYRAALAGGLEVHEDAITTMRALADDRVPIAVASSSLHASVVRVLEAADAVDLVDVVIGADDVEVHKPDPEPYLTAARRLGVPAERCSAVEDTSVGVAAAVAAGMFTVAILRAHNDADQLAAAHRVVDTITVGSLAAGSDAGSDAGRS